MRLWLQLLAIACAVSALASGRFVPRLVLDGAISFTFIPAFELLALFLMTRRRSRNARFGAVADRFFAGHTPWLLWLVAVAAIGCFVPSRPLMAWLRPMIFSSAVPIGWSAILDFQFFRGVFGRRTGAAVGDVLLFRALSWIPSLLYFFGIALWAIVVPHLGVAVNR